MFDLPKSLSSNKVRYENEEDYYDNGDDVQADNEDVENQNVNSENLDSQSSKSESQNNTLYEIVKGRKVYQSELLYNKEYRLLNYISIKENQRKMKFTMMTELICRNFPKNATQIREYMEYREFLRENHSDLKRHKCVLYPFGLSFDKELADKLGAYFGDKPTDTFDMSNCKSFLSNDATDKDHLDFNLFMSQWDFFTCFSNLFELDLLLPNEMYALLRPEAQHINIDEKFDRNYIQNPFMSRLFAQVLKRVSSEVPASKGTNYSFHYIYRKMSSIDTAVVTPFIFNDYIRFRRCKTNIRRHFSFYLLL